MQQIFAAARPATTFSPSLLSAVSEYYYIDISGLNCANAANLKQQKIYSR
jgi:hypothetical protein